MNRILIVGGGVAGLNAAVNAKRKDPSSKIIIISKEPYNAYRRPAIPSLISGEITDWNEANIFPLKLLNNLGIEYFSGVEAKSIDVKNNTVVVAKVDTNENGKIEYDNLILSMGGIPSMPKISGLDKKGICTFTTYDSACEILKYSKDSKSAVVVGAGFIGLEIAEALLKRGLKVYFNVRSRILRRLLEPDMSDYLIKRFTEKGLIMLVGESISDIGGNSRVSNIKYKNDIIETDMVIFGMGVNPSVDIVKNSGIELGETGAIKVNNKMQTNIPNIFAVGDCAESLDLTTGEFVYYPVGSIAALGGEIAGINAAGGNIETKGFVRAQADKIFGEEIISIGHSSVSAKEVNLNVKVVDISEESKKFDIGRKYPALIKVVLTEDDTIVGAQVITKKYGSVYSYGLFNAMLNKEKFSNFIDKWRISLNNLENLTL